MIPSVITAALAAATTLALTLAAGSAAAAPALDAKGQCRDAGKPVSASLCRRPAPAPKPMCRADKGGQVVACGTPGAKPAGDQSLGGALDALRAPPKR